MENIKKNLLDIEKNKAGVMSVDDANFSNRIEELLSQEGNEYGN